MIILLISFKYAYSYDEQINTVFNEVGVQTGVISML